MAQHPDRAIANAVLTVKAFFKTLVADSRTGVQQMLFIHGPSPLYASALCRCRRGDAFSRRYDWRYDMIVGAQPLGIGTAPGSPVEGCPERSGGQQGGFRGVVKQPAATSCASFSISPSVFQRPAAVSPASAAPASITSRPTRSSAAATAGTGRRRFFDAPSWRKALVGARANRHTYLHAVQLDHSRLARDHALHRRPQALEGPGVAGLKQERSSEE